MGSAATVDFERLLRPIPGASPTGIDLRAQNPDSHDSIYWQLRSARNESGEIERNHIKDPTNTDPEYDLHRCRWSEIISKAEDVLAGQSKDLEVAAWLCDSLTRVHGFAGLRDGLRLARELAEKYWDSLFPSLGGSSETVVAQVNEMIQKAGQLEKEGKAAEAESVRGEVRDFCAKIAARVNQFGGLFRGRQNPALRIPLTNGDKFTELDYEQAQLFEKITDPKEKAARIAKDEITPQKFRDAVRDTSTAQLIALVEDIEASLAEGKKLVDVLKPKCGKNDRGEDIAPSAREFSEVLENVLKVVRREAGERIKPAPPPAADGGEAQGPEGNGSAGGSKAARPKELTRDVALSQMRELADFFKKSEPHSPISHHLDEAVRWGQLSLPDLLTELIPDEKSRKELFTRIGIAPAVPAKK
jgi:type VI secretion system protein ImpA